MLPRYLGNNFKCPLDFYVVIFLQQFLRVSVIEPISALWITQGSPALQGSAAVMGSSTALLFPPVQVQGSALLNHIQRMNQVPGGKNFPLSLH